MIVYSVCFPGVRLWYSDVALALKQFESSTDFTLREVCQWILDLL